MRSLGAWACLFHIGHGLGAQTPAKELLHEKEPCDGPQNVLANLLLAFNSRVASSPPQLGLETSTNSHKQQVSFRTPRHLGCCRLAQPAMQQGGPALLCDCDGTLVETERDGHRVAFNQAFKEVGIDAEWDVALYGDLLTTGGGKERMTRYFLDYNPKAWPHPEPPAKDHLAIMQLHELKTKLFMDIVGSGALPLREGVKDLLTAAKAAGWTIAVCSTSNEKAVQQVVNTALPEFAKDIRVFAGDVVKAKKPDPAIYNLAALVLGLDPKKCVVVEDTNIGLRAGKEAGMTVVVTRSIYSEDEDFTGADFNVANAEAISFEKDLAPLFGS
jgi:HAD superfamily hydrolase (TIGR01509 family)